MVSNVWPRAIVLTCIIDLIRHSFRLTSHKCWDEVKRDLKPIDTAINADAAKQRTATWPARWGELPGPHPRVGERLGDSNPFSDYYVEISQVICSTNAFESLNARYRRAVCALGHFPTERAALKAAISAVVTRPGPRDAVGGEIIGSCMDLRGR